MTILSFPHYGQHGFDDIDIGEEVGLEGILDKRDSLTTLRQLFYGTNNG